MDYMAELAAIANKNGGIIETKTAAQRGISKAMLYKLCKAEPGRYAGRVAVHQPPVWKGYFFP